jgi:transcriptional regulator with XRE-family HTH domain
VEVGPTGHLVRVNVQRLRRAAGLSVRGLSQALAEAGRPLGASAISDIESGKRRVDADDLAALAVVLGANPNALLLPPISAFEDEVEVTGAGTVTAAAAWDWADGRAPLPGQLRDRSQPQLEFLARTQPAGSTRFTATLPAGHQAGLPDDPAGRRLAETLNAAAQQIADYRTGREG